MGIESMINGQCGFILSFSDLTNRIVGANDYSPVNGRITNPINIASPGMQIPRDCTSPLGAGGLKNRDVACRVPTVV